MEIVKRLVDILGFKLVAYIAKVQDTKIVERWMSGDELPEVDILVKFALAFTFADCIGRTNSNEVARVWFMGVKEGVLPEGMSPARLLHIGGDPIVLCGHLMAMYQDSVAVGAV